LLDSFQLPLKFFANGAKGLSFYHPWSIPVESTFAWVGYSISKDRDEEAVDMIPCLYSVLVILITNIQTGNTTPSVQMENAWLTGRKNNIILLPNANDAPSFYFWRWNTSTDPDLAFVRTSDRYFHDRRVLEWFSWSQHRPSLITSPKIVVPVPSESYKRWNFRKIN